MKALVKFAVRLLVVLLILFCGAIIYLDVHGFPPFLTAIVVNQLERQGVAAHFSSIRLDVLRGIIAKDATLARAEASEQMIARIDELQIIWNWPRLFRGGNGIDALRIANANLSVPTPPDEIGPEVFTAEQAYASFRFEDDGSIQIDQLTGVYAGIRLRLAGHLKLRSTAPATAPNRPGSGRSPFVFVTKALRELNSLHGTEPPQLDADFDLDLSDPIKSRVTTKLIASNVMYRKVEVEKLSVDVSMHDGAIDIPLDPPTRLQVGKGELSIHGRYDIAGGGFDLHLDSSLDPNLFLPSLPPELTGAIRDLHLLAPPRIAIHYVLSPETGILPVLEGRVEFGALEYRTVLFRSIVFDFENKGPDLKLSDVKVVMREGELTGHGQYQIETSDFSYEIDSTLDPRKLLPLMFTGPREIVEPSWFETAPHIVASVRGDFVDPEAFAYDATLNTGRCSYRGVALKAVNAQVKLRRNRLDVSDLLVQRDEGDARGAVWADFDRHRIGFDLQVTANPSEMAPLLGPKPREIMQPYRFGPHTSGTAHGMIDLDEITNTCWQGHVTNEGFSCWKLTSAQATADVAMTNGTLHIDNFDGEFYGGKLRGKAAFTLTNNPAYQFDFAVDHAEVRRLLTALSGKENGTSGFVTSQAVISGQGSDLGTLKGRGNVAVVEGVLWEIPVFGIFSHILNDIDPGLGTAKATRADASFVIENKYAKTDDLLVKAGPFTVDGRGKVGFDGKLDFVVEGQLLRSWPGINLLTWFLKNVFKYKIGGTVGNYTYRPVNLPKEFLPHGDADKKEKGPPVPDTETPQ